MLAGESYKLGGDIIVAAGGRPVASLDRLRDIVADEEARRQSRVVVYRGNEQDSLDVKLGRQPARGPPDEPSTENAAVTAGG